MGDLSYIYAISDEKATDGFILVGSETEINLDTKKKKATASVYHLHADKNKPTCFLAVKKATTINISEINSLVDDDLFKYGSKTRTVQFTKKSYEKLVEELKGDDEEEESEESESEEVVQTKKKTEA